MIDCIHRRGKRCGIGKFGGNPTDIDCLRKCADRIRLRGEPAKIRVEGRTIVRGNVMYGGSWFDNPNCPSCEPKRRFARDWFERWDTSDGEPMRNAAD